MGRSPDKQARAEVHLLQQVGLHLRGHGQHLAGQGRHRPGRPAQETVGLLLLLEAPVGMLETGRPTGPLGQSLRTSASESGAPFVRQVSPPKTEKPPESTFEAPALCSCCHRHRMDAACHVWGYRTKGHPGRHFQKPHAGRRQSYQLFDKGRQAG